MSELTLALARRLSHEHFTSGEDLAQGLACSRVAIWKHAATLRDLGVVLEAVAGKGYRLAEPLELLDRARILAALGDRAGDLNRLEIVEVTGSTNADLLALAPGAADGVARLAERQTGGRGRRGRAWVSPFARNLYLSLGWRFEAGLGALGFLPLVVAVAVARAVEASGVADVGLKWPNDIVTPRGKLGGCLVEVQGDLGGPCRAVLGVGLNVRLSGAPGLEAIDQDWDELAAGTNIVSRNAMAGRLLNHLIDAVSTFEAEGFEAAGFAAFEADWERFDRLAGRDIELLVERRGAGAGDPSIERGRCRGLGPRGGLLLEQDDQCVERLSGEARLRPGSLADGQK